MLNYYGICLLMLMMLSLNAEFITNLSYKIEFIVDFLNAQHCCSKLIAVTCLKREKKVKIWKSLKNNSLYIDFWKPEQIIENLPSFMHPVTFIVDTQCDECKTMLNEVDSLNYHSGFRYFQEPFQWILFGYDDVPSLDIIYFDRSSRIFTVTEGNRNYFKVQSIFKHSRADARSKINNIGLYTFGKGFQYFNKLVYTQNRSDFEGADLKYLQVEYDLKSSLDDKNERINVILWQTCLYLNATFISPIMSDAGENKSVDIFSLLNRGYVDLIGTTSKVYQNQFRYLDQTATNAIVFIYRAPGLAYTQNVYSIPFYTTSWICLLAILILSSSVMYLIVYLHRNISRNTELRLSLSDVVLLQCAPILQKSIDCELKSCSGRVATAFLHFSSMLLTSFYIASLMVYLQATAGPIKSFEELYGSGLQLGADNNISGVYQRYMQPLEKPSDEELRKTIFNERIKGKQFFFSAKEGIQKVRTELFAYETHLATAYDMVGKYFDELEKCSLQTAAGFLYDKRHIYFVVAKNSSAADLYRIGFRKTIESGLHRRDYLLSIDKKPKCDGSAARNFSGTGIAETKFVFFVFIFGVLLSLVLFILEIIWHGYRHSMKYYEHLNWCLRLWGGTGVQVYTE